MNRSSLFFLLLCLALPATAQTKASSAPAKMPCGKLERIPAGPEGEIMQADLEFCHDTHARGVEGWVSWFAENGSMLGAKVSTGRDAIREQMKDFLSTPGLVFVWKPYHAEVLPSGDTGYTVGHSHTEYKDSQGVLVSRNTSYITIWKKQKDGTWKVFADTGSTDPAPKAKVVPLGQNEKPKKD